MARVETPPDDERGQLSQELMPPAVRALAIDLLDRVDELSQQMAAHLHGQIPELGQGDPELFAETLASCRANIDQSYRLMSAGAGAENTVVMPEAREYVREFVRRGIKVPVLLRTYRLGHAWIWEVWNEQLRARIAEPQELSEAVEYSSRWMFTYIDHVSAGLVEEFAREQARRMRTAEQLRADTVEEVLAGGSFDEEVASRRLGYDLRRRHLAMHVHSRADRPRGTERAALDVAQLLGAGPPLVVPAGAGSLDAWCSPGTRLDDEAVIEELRRYTPPDGVSLAVGGCIAGQAGFRVSHQEARQAARIAVLGPPPPASVGVVTIYADVELAALLCADLERARRFVARRLGPLAADDDQAQRLRQTVLAYLRAGRSTGRAAEALFVHQNTVTYRVRSAEELLGRPVTDETAELLCALLLAEATGPPPAATGR